MKSLRELTPKPLGKTSWHGPPVLLALLLCLAGGEARAQEDSADDQPTTEFRPAQRVGERMYEALQSSDAREPDTKTTYVRGANGKAVVAKVIAEIGSRRLIKLPTGEYDIVDRKDTRKCDRPFVSASRSQIAAKIRADGFKDFKIVPAGYFLFAYDCSEPYYLHTRSLMESMLSGVIKQLRDWGLEPKRPETPMVVMIVGSREAFDAIEPMPPSVAAYYSMITNRVVLYEDQRLWEAAPEFAFKQAAYTIVHEGIHQLLANTGIQQRFARWPLWISEGLPEYFCPMKVNTKLITKNDSQLPERTLTWRRAGEVNDLRMWELMRNRSYNGSLINHVVTSSDFTSNDYAISWGLVHYLASRKTEEFKAYLKDISQLRTLEKREYRGADPLFVKHFGEEFAIIEKRVQRHLLSKPLQKSYRDPAEYQTRYVMKHIIKRGKTFYTTIALTRSPAEAREWRNQRLALADAEGRKSAFYTIVCKTKKEANYHLRKLGYQIGN